MSPSLLIIIIIDTVILLFINKATSVEFMYNTDFNSTNILTYGNATIQSSILTLTDDHSIFSLGRALYPFKVPTRQSNSSSLLLPFSTSFIFSIAPSKELLPGHGFAFAFVPHTGISNVRASQHLGLFNYTNNGDPNNSVFAVEFDVYRNEEFGDINNNHVGVDLNSLYSAPSELAGFWEENGGVENFKELKLNSGVNYQVWIDYEDMWINITMAKVGDGRPFRPLISAFLNLSSVLLDEMYVGFSGSTGRLVESHKILAWSFSNSNFSIGDALVTTNLPSFVPSKVSLCQSKRFIVGITFGSVLVIGCGVLIYKILIRRKTRENDDEEAMEEWELEYWPHRIRYQEIYTATKGFSDGNVIGFGGNGKVYKGTLQGVEVAVKRISMETQHGTKEFLAEISCLGRLTHRNLVKLRGWCKRDKGNFILVYDYMENGSLDKWIFESDKRLILSWEERIEALKDVASGILYLHEGWQAKVLHRDIKASNVLLDKDMKAKLGDFGLARMHHHDKMANTTKVIGTVGYMAPEVIKTGRASIHTDVFGFGVLVLEVVCGRRPIEEGKPGLIEHLWMLMEKGDLISVLDDKLKVKGGYSEDEVKQVLQLGLLCAHHDPCQRPTMRQVLKVLEGTISNRADESERDESEMSLLDRMQKLAMWSNHHRNNNGAAANHPTFNEIREAFSSPPVTSTDLLEGR